MIKILTLFLTLLSLSDFVRASEEMIECPRPIRQEEISIIGNGYLANWKDWKYNNRTGILIYGQSNVRLKRLTTTLDMEGSVWEMTCEFHDWKKTGSVRNTRKLVKKITPDRGCFLTDTGEDYDYDRAGGIWCTDILRDQDLSYDEISYRKSQSRYCQVHCY